MDYVRHGGNHFPFDIGKLDGRVGCLVGVPPGDHGFTVDGNDPMDDEGSVALVNHHVSYPIGVLGGDYDHIVDLKLRLHTAGKNHGRGKAQWHGHFIAAQATGVPGIQLDPQEDACKDDDDDAKDQTFFVHKDS